MTAWIARVTGKDLVAALRKAGFDVERQRGSHRGTGARRGDDWPGAAGEGPSRLRDDQGGVRSPRVARSSTARLHLPAGRDRPLPQLPVRCQAMA